MTLPSAGMGNTRHSAPRLRSGSRNLQTPCASVKTGRENAQTSRADEEHIPHLEA